MFDSHGPVFKIIGWFVTLAFPFAIILSAVRILLTPAWVNIEYRMPGFPEDTYGFTLQERVKWATVSLDYLLNDEGIEYFNRQRFSDDVVIYNQRELQHMEDVKNVVGDTLMVWYISLGFVVLVGLLSRWGEFGETYRTALQRGAWLTIGLVGTVILIVVLAFGVFFVAFHNIFFAAGTWTFSYSDTLIRLFPERFWQDAFLWIGALSIFFSFWLISLSKPRKSREVPTR